MKSLVILAALVLGVLASVDDLEADNHRRMHISPEEVHEVGAAKKLIEEIEDAKAKENKAEGPDVVVKEDPNLPHEKSESDNHKEDEDVIGGDEKMTPEQINEVLEGELAGQRRRKRQFASYMGYGGWQTDIDFFISDTLDKKIVPLVRQGTKWINDHSCFNLKEVSSRDRARKPYLTYNSGTWCQSYVGRVTNDEQIIEMVPQCGHFGTIIHETLHALGFEHEQNRDDRDDYVNIRFGDLYGRRNFAKTDKSEEFGLPYHYGSLMAYPGNANSKTGRETIVAKDQKYQRAMGYRFTGAFADARRLNAGYGCLDKCPRGPNCKNGGFRHPKRCNTCECPETFTGTDCSRFQPKIDPTGSNRRDCGGTQQITSSSEKKFVLKAAAAQNKGHYCNTKFEAPTGKVIRFRMEKGSGDKMPCQHGCNYGFVELNPGLAAEGGRDFGVPGYRDCCVDEIYTGAVTTKSNVLVATAFARKDPVQLTVYVSAVNGRNSTPKPTTGGTTRRTTRRATTRDTTRRATTKKQPTGKKCVRRSRYNFVRPNGQEQARVCCDQCSKDYRARKIEYDDYLNCFNCCLEKYSTN